MRITKTKFRVEKLLSRGDKLVEAGLFDEAFIEYQTALEDEPRNPLPYIGIGRVLELTGKLEDARVAYQ